MTSRSIGFLGIAIAVALGCAPRLRAEQSAETRLKAAVVSKLPQFVDWPAASLAGRPTVDICVVSPDPFGQDLEKLVAGDTVGGHPVVVRRVDREQDLNGCHLVYLPAAAIGPHRALFQRAASLPILTVSDDDERFLEDGGIVRLRLVGGRVRFDVNAGAARQVGLRISSQLLQLAVTVRGAQP